MARRYDRNVKPWEFVTNDLVLQKNGGKHEGSRCKEIGFELGGTISSHHIGGS